jgi:hypothetical protein
MSAINYYGLKIYDRPTVSAREFNKLVDVVKSLTLNDGVGYRVARNPSGTNLNIKPGLGGKTCPFTVTTAADPSTPGNVIVSVSAGTVNSLLSSNNFDTPSVDSTEIVQVKVHVLTDGNAVTSCTLVIDDTPAATQTPTPFALPSTVDILIAVIVNGVPYRTIGCGSIQLTGALAYTTSYSAESPAPPGVSDITSYYAWTVSTV